MWSLSIVIAGIVFGYLLGYLAGAYLACLVLNMGNLCGLVGVFGTGPVGAIGRGTAGWFSSRRG